MEDPIYKIHILENACTFALEQLEFISEQLRYFDIIYTPEFNPPSHKDTQYLISKFESPQIKFESKKGPCSKIGC